MKKMQKNRNKRLRPFLLPLLLLAAGTGAGWGQEDTKYTITPASNTTSVHSETQVIYVDPANQRELYVPELRINHTMDYNWYVHWYVKGSGTIAFKSITINKDDANIQGGTFYHNPNESNDYATTNNFKKDANSGLWWSPALDNDSKQFSTDAATIFYTLPTNYTDGDTVFCDVSNYKDYTLSGTTFSEPTLLKRYKFVIKSVDDLLGMDYGQIPFLEEYFPANSTTVNLSMAYPPNNYFWEEEGKWIQANDFAYCIGSETGTYTNFNLKIRNTKGEYETHDLKNLQTQRLEELSTATSPVEVYVKAVYKKNGKEEKLSPHAVAKYRFHPVAGSGFMFEENLDDARKPGKFPDLYRLVGSYDFDMENTVTSITTENNTSSTPLPSTTYGFFHKDKETLSKNPNAQNMYGLFRSALHKDVSENYKLTDTNSQNKYQWIPPTGDPDHTELYNTNTALYDRTYIDSKGTDEEKYGFFFYTDAADNPGLITDLPILEICANTELTLTMWVADMTRAHQTGTGRRPLAPNLNIRLTGVKDGAKEILHRFTTGDAITQYDESNINTALMKWQQLFHHFVIDNKQIAQYRDFKVEVYNNEPHTDGADYAIDAICLYETTPKVQVVQSNAMCDPEVKDVKFLVDYNRILTNLGLEADAQTNDNVTADEVPQQMKDWAEDKGMNLTNEVLPYMTRVYYNIYEAADSETSIHLPYDPDGEELKAFGTSFLSTKKGHMEWAVWPNNFNQSSEYVTFTDIHAQGILEESKEYTARISGIDLSLEGEMTLKDNVCALTDQFTLVTPDEMFDIRYGTNSILEKPEDALVGTPYTITGKLQYKESETDTEIKTYEAATFDWFKGSMEEFTRPNTVLVDGKPYSIHEALLEAHNSGNGNETAFQAALQGQWGERFTFAQKEITHTLTKIAEPIVFIAHNVPTEDGVIYCSDPKEIWLGGRAPEIEPGDPDVPNPDPEPDPDDPDPDPKDPDPDPEDPDTPAPKPDDDPDSPGKYVRSVRLGLMQIRDMLSPEGTDDDGTLRIPIHARRAISDSRRFFMAEDKGITVRSTSDGDWEETDNPVATLVALEDAAGSPPAWDIHYFKIKFNEGIPFREGFWYMLEIPFKECSAETDPEPQPDATSDEEAPKVYVGSFKLTLKIVPEYVTWVGSEANMHNWNNDGPKHWRRSTDEELYTEEIAGANGTHTEAYTPMRFTKVTVAGKPESTPYAAYPHLYKLEKQSGENDVTGLLDMSPADMDATIGGATHNIEYDLLADPDYQIELNGTDANPDKEANGHSYACVRFYGNACDEIYFKPESELLHTEFLAYTKARVDYEMAPNRWYMLASPLKGVVSGDMYLPTGSLYGAQKTPAFEDIAYTGTDYTYTRWAPAVYMRGWDKASGEVVKQEGAGINYAIASSWTNLYNKVNETFTPGTGFSVGTKFENAAVGSKVLFRLPKGDASYAYYENGDANADNSTTLTEAERAGNGRFLFSSDTTEYTATLTNTTAGNEHFMLGNPFMAHLDIATFFNENSSVLPTENVYYILDGSGMGTTLLGNLYTISTESEDPAEANLVAPLQSFIVKGTPDGEVKFTTGMIARATASGTPGLRSMAGAAPTALPQLRITASRDGVKNTAVVASLATSADDFVEGEDAALLADAALDAPQVYTLAGNRLAAINVVPAMQDIPLGIYGTDVRPVDLSFRLTGGMGGVTLLDKQSGKSYPLADGFTLSVPGNTSGRYFLRGSNATANETVVRQGTICYSGAPGRIDILSDEPLEQASVYTVSGRQIALRDRINNTAASIGGLETGVYIVRIQTATETCSVKVEVR